MRLKFFIHTYGCQMNVRESEAITALLSERGHIPAANESEADLVIVNSCTVRQKAEEKAIGKAGNLIADGKITAMTGCAVVRLKEDIFRKLPKLDFATGARAFDEIPNFVEKIVSGQINRLSPVSSRFILGAERIPCGMGAHPPPKSHSAFVTAMIGCDNRCSYCIVPDTRGHEYSRPAGEIIAEIASLAVAGVKEVTLLGQSVLRYRGFPQLLRKISEIDGIERIRFTSAHPKGCTDELIAVYRDCPQVCRHLHLPVQSGSDRLLAEMGRRYTRKEYLAAVEKLRGFDPEFAVTTDVIVGYPGETEADFEATRSLMDEAGFDNAFIFKYSPRPGTRSAALNDDVPKEEKERRDQVLLADQEMRGQLRNDRLVGTVRKVLAEGPSKRNRSRFSGREGGNRIVVWDDDGTTTAGSFVDIRITEAHPQILLGTKDVSAR